MKTNRQFNRGIIKFTFTDEDGEVFSSFKMNPTDVNLMKRAEEVSEYFKNRKEDIPECTGTEELQEFNREIEDKINYLLGYDASSEIFSDDITATTVSQDGKIFAFEIFDFIAEKLEPEIEKRKNSMQKNIDKYTAKYSV